MGERLFSRRTGTRGERGGVVLFVGEYKHTIDEKNRIFIPSRLRSELGERFMVTKGFDRCLFVFPMPKWEAFAAKIAALPMVKKPPRTALLLFQRGRV